MDEEIIRVFLMDDDEDDYVLTRDMLAEAVGVRFELDWAETYQAGLEAMERAEHDVYLVDYRLGEQDGVELLRAAIARGCRAPIIILTGRGDHAVDVAAMEAGAADFLDKGGLSAELLERSIRYAIERQRAEERLEHLNLVLRAIRSVNQLIVREKDRDRLLQDICDSLTETRGYHNAWTALLDDEESKLVMTAEAGLGEGFALLVERLKRGEWTACGRRALSQPEVVVTEDPPSACADCPLAKNYVGRGALTIRLEHGGKVYGLLSAAIPAHLTADREEQVLFEEVAGDIAFALHNLELEEERKRMEEAVRKSEEKYRTLVSNINDLVMEIDSDGNFTYVSPQIFDMFGYTQEESMGLAAFDFVHPDDIEKCMNAMATMDEVKHIEYRSRHKDGHYVHVSTSGRSISDGVGGFKTVSVLRDITELKRAEESLRQSHAKLQRALGGTIHALVSAIELRDPYTAGHQRRTSVLACAIANELGLPEEQIEGLRMAARIHDLGKMTVPAEVLSKPSKLSSIEWGMIKVHPQIGHDLLKGLDFPWPLADIVLQHHERLDGSGYPQGLSDGQIMLEARILAVADVVEAMSSHRPYRPAHSMDKALEEISQNRGRLYDAEAVDACLKLFTGKGFEFE